jgi:hypothetical protein
LEVEVLHREVFRFNLAGDDWLKFRFRWQGQEPKHFEKLRTVGFPFAFPIFEGVNAFEAALLESRGLRLKIIRQELVRGRFPAWPRPIARERNRQKSKNANGWVHPNRMRRPDFPRKLFSGTAAGFG